MSDSDFSKRSHSFQATRTQHFLETAEDYTELIADLIQEKGVARTCDIARALGVSHVTALKTMRRLESEGYLTTEPHKPVHLSQKGKRLAAKSKKRHRIIYEYLLQLGVSESIAAMDSEGIEHHLSPETLQAISAHLELIKEQIGH